MHDFRDGLRKQRRRQANTNRMIGFAKNMTDDEIKHGRVLRLHKGGAG